MNILEYGKTFEITIIQFSYLHYKKSHIQQIKITH